MKTAQDRAKERRQYSRVGLFGQIEDVTYQLLRRSENDASETDPDNLAALAEGTAIAAVNVTIGLSGGEPLDEPF